ncbi:MAG: hypothetical protein Q9220_007233 [cf. Caloplaca sp. 1 TL-2023]
MDSQQSFYRLPASFPQLDSLAAWRRIFFLFVIITVGFWLASSVKKRADRRSLARGWGCKPLRSPDRNDIFGWKAFKTLHNARAEQEWLIAFGRGMDEVGRNPHTVQRKILTNKFLMTRDPENIKYILSDHVSDWELGIVRGEIFSLLIGPNLVTTKGQAWKHSRSRVRPQFSKDSLLNLGLFGPHVRDLCARLEVDGEGWTNTVDLQPMFFNLTLDVASEFLFGQSLHSQDPDQQERAQRLGMPNAQTFGHSLDQASDWLATASLWGKWYWLLPSRQFRRNRAAVRAMVDWNVDRVLKTQQLEKSDSANRFVLLEELVKLTSDRLWLRNETLSLLTGGRSTTAALLSWLFYYLAREPATYQHLRSTILNDFGPDADDAPINNVELRASQYLQNCIREALRLGSPTHSTYRQALRDTKLPQGGGPEGEDPIFVPKGTTVLLGLFNLHHRKDIWGQDVEKFRPERWDHRERNWEYSPFGGGPRTCIGRK